MLVGAGSRSRLFHRSTSAARSRRFYALVMIDVDQLISAVFARRAIWDRREKLYSNRQWIDKCWKEISSQLKQNETKLRKKWKYLRDQFSVELGKLPDPYSGDEADNPVTSKWPYFTQLLFLRDLVKPRRTAMSSKALTSTEFTQQDMENEATVDEMLKFDVSEEELNLVVPSPMSSRGSTPSISNSAPRSKKRRLPTDEFTESLLEIERRKLQHLENNFKSNTVEEDDHHLLFFKSLLPYVRLIPQTQILNFRGQVQDLVQQFTYPTSSLFDESTAYRSENIKQNICNEINNE